MVSMEISKTFTFEASHILPKHPGKCSRLHGHSWVLTVYVKGDVNPETGFVMDYGDLKAAVQPIVDRLDHRHLGMWYNPRECFVGSFEIDLHQDNSVLGLATDFYPSSENLIVWIAEQIGDKLDAQVIGEPLHIWSKLELNETCTSKCILTREDYEKQAGRG